MISFIATLLMTKTSLGPKAAKLASWAAMLSLVLLAVWLAYSWAYDRGRDDERSKWEAAAELLEDADAAADAEAQDVAHDTKESIDATNQRAADAAAKSDDPLKSGIDSLRSESSGRRN